MSRGCIKARGRLYRFRRNVILNVLLKGLPRPMADLLKAWAERRKTVEIWMCEEDSQ